jgi:UDP-glucose 4-epimerase
MSKILVTGGAGFIGSHVADYLIEKGHEVTVLDDLSGGLKENVNPRAKFVQGSILNHKLVDKCVEGKDVIYHLAAYAAEGLSPFIRRFNHMNNLVGSVNLINAAIKNKVKCFVFTSSLAVYGEGEPPFEESRTPGPVDPYGVSKYAVEMELQIAQKQHGLDYVIIRPHNVYGERQFLGDPYRNVLGIFMNRIMQGKAPLIYGDGQQTRAFSYIGDVAPCIAESAFIEKAKNQIINLGAAKPYTIKQLASEVKKAMSSDLNPEHVAPRHEVKHAHCTTKKSEELLNFVDKTSLEDGIRRMAEWAKSTGPMEPIVWDGYELTEKLPSFWKNLKDEFPKSTLRVNIDSAIKEIFSPIEDDEISKLLENELSLSEAEKKTGLDEY